MIQQGTVKRTRSSKSKVRTGCVTCKIRRIKCDEAKPWCVRCTSTGRKCDGYTTVRSAGTPTNEPAEELYPRRRMVEGESRALDFFYHSTAPQLSGFFGRALWDAVLQHSLTEPSIRHAIIALATLHRDLGTACTSRSEAIGRRDRRAFALKSYGRAMNALQRRALDTGAAPLMALASIVFACFECLLGDAKAVATHVMSGICVLKMVREVSGEPSGAWGLQYRSFEASFIETRIAPVLCTLSICVAEFGSPGGLLYLNSVDGHGCPIFGEPFHDLSQARYGLTDIVTAALRIVWEDSVSSQATVNMAYLRSVLGRWEERFDDLVRRRESSWSDQDRGGADLIRAMWQSTAVGLSAGSAADETAWDGHKTAYENILRLVESLIARQGYSPRCETTFHFEMGIISPLHLVAWKCRWPDLRRKGLALLLSCSRQECLYDARLYYAVFSRIMEIEEGINALGPSNQTSDQPTLPPEQARVHHFHCEPHPSDTHGETHILKIFTRPNWPDRAWHLQVEPLRVGRSEALNQAVFSSNTVSSGSQRLPVVNLFRTKPVLHLSGSETRKQLPDQTAIITVI